MPSRFKNIERKIVPDFNENYGCLMFLVFVFILLIYSLYTINYFWILVSVIFIYLGINSLIEEHLNKKKLKLWFIENQGQKIFFYPTNKIQQQQILEPVVTDLDNDILQVYYDGPKLIGDISNEYVMRFMLNPLNNESPNLPKFLTVANDGLNLICTLPEFMEDEFDSKLLNQLIAAMNVYLDLEL